MINNEEWDDGLPGVGVKCEVINKSLHNPVYEE